MEKVDYTGDLPAEWIETIIRVSKQSAWRFQFGSHTREDLEQHAMYKCLETIRKGDYNQSLPLENFLRRHCYNRLINFKRDNFCRNEPPCKTCPLFDKKKKICTEYGENKSECEPYMDWNKKNRVRKSLLSPSNIEQESFNLLVDRNDQDGHMELVEIRNYIDEHLPYEYREDYLKLLSRAKLPKGRKPILRAVLLDIIEQYKNGGGDG